MTTAVELGPIVKTIEVARTAADAFDVFVSRIGAWWPLASHSRARDEFGEKSETVVIEPRVGGRFYERLTTGEELEWGEVLVFEPGKRLTLTWRLGRKVATEVDVRFEDVDLDRCRVTLSHAGWEKMEAEAASVRGGYAQGWELVFGQRFADAAAKPTILGLAQSNLVWTVRIAAAEKGVEIDLEENPPHSDPVNAAHPLGKMPALRHGAFTLGESRAIALYLDRAFPGAGLTPPTPREAAEVEQWISIALTEFDPVFVRQFLFAYIFAGPDGPDAVQIAAATPGLARNADVLEAQLAGRDWLCGKAFTLADAFVLPILIYSAGTPEGEALLATRRNLAQYVARGRERASVAATMPPQAQR
jgi:glutathione S-transferase